MVYIEFWCPKTRKRIKIFRISLIFKGALVLVFSACSGVPKPPETVRFSTFMQHHAFWLSFASKSVWGKENQVNSELWTMDSQGKKQRSGIAKTMCSFYLMRALLELESVCRPACAAVSAGRRQTSPTTSAGRGSGIPAGPFRPGCSQGAVTTQAIIISPFWLLGKRGTREARFPHQKL